MISPMLKIFAIIVCIVIFILFFGKFHSFTEYQIFYCAILTPKMKIFNKKIYLYRRTINF